MMDNVDVWVDGIPTNWKLTKLKHVATKLSRPMKSSDEMLVCTNKGQVSRRGDKSAGLVSLTENGYQGVRPGDLLIHGMDTWHGAIAVSDLAGKCTSVVHVCDSSEDKRFLAYYLRALSFRGVYKAFSNGVRQNTSDFRSWVKAGEIPVVLPELKQQQRIAEYLDDKCAEIDAAIEAAEASIEEYKAYEKNLIFHVVTRGLKKDSVLKKTDFDWIGSVPEKWNLVPVRAFLTEINVKNDPVQTNQILSLMKDKGVMPYEEKGDVGNKAKESINGYKLAYPNTIVANSMNVLIGSVGISSYFGCVSPVYYVFRCSNKADIRYINYVFATRRFQQELRKYAKGILEIRLRVSSRDILSRKIPNPPLEEQKEIADYLDAKCAEIAKVVEAKQAIIEDLKAYKQSLIYETVTGKREVYIG